MFVDTASGVLRILATPSDSQAGNWADLAEHVLNEVAATPIEVQPLDKLVFEDSGITDSANAVERILAPFTTSQADNWADLVEKTLSEVGPTPIEAEPSDDVGSALTDEAGALERILASFTSSQDSNWQDS